MGQGARKALLGGLGAGGALAAYALFEPHRYRLAIRDLEVRPGVPHLDVLHLSDTHLGGGYRRRARWLSELPERLGVTPDLVLATGDLIQDDSGIDLIIEVLAGLEARLGRFYVLGSHDYFQSKFQNYGKYWTGNKKLTAPPANSDRLEQGLQAKGWSPLTNRTEFVTHEEGRIRLAGVDDPYLNRQRTAHIERGEQDLCAIGLMHSPEVVSEYSLAGFDLVLAGHTHAGQVRIPFAGAVVTNSSLPTALAGGAHRVGESWLHVSPGLGHGRFSPIRFNARPEATLLRLRPHR
ncbi:MAG: metallophosphoesterase [Actinomycetota bacterium]